MKIKRTLALLALAAALLARAAAAPGHSPAEVREAFAAAAFSVEYGAGGGVLRRWETPLRYLILGGARPEDRAAIEGFLAQLREKVPGLPLIEEAGGEADASLIYRFAPLAALPGYDSIYVSGNWGFFSFYFNDRQELYRAQALIASDVTTQGERNHLLMEETVGLLGLSNDITSHEGSILYQPWTTTQALSALDWELLNLLYDERLSPGMSFPEAAQALGWQR